MKKVWFEKCDCGATAAHGYFHGEGMGKCPVPTYSLEAGEVMLKLLTDKFHLSCGETAQVRGQLRAAGLAEKVTSTEWEALSAYGLLVALAR